MNMNNIMRSLPLVASVLGKKYGVKVVVGGSSAFTDRSTIYLPSLPPEGTDTQLGLIRGYIDHESAHIRHTDFDVLKEPGISPLKKHLWNILEDWRVENALAKRFPGCRRNFNWLIHHTFAKKKHKLNPDPGIKILDYILLSVRAWDVASVSTNKTLVGAELGKQYMNLLWEINAVLNNAKLVCKSSACCMRYAEKLVKLIENHAQPKEESKEDSKDKAKTQSNEADGESSGKPEKALKKLLSAGDSDLPDDMSETVAKQLKSSVRNEPGMIVATEGRKHAELIPANEIAKVKQASVALHARLHALLQSRKLNRSRPGRSGKLDSHRLNRIWHSNKVFLRNEERQGVNTLVHILLDCSGSMKPRMELATQACYAVANSLSRIDGVKLAVTAFPARSKDSQPTVAPLLTPDQKLHSKFSVTASGGTPLGETIWWALQRDCIRPEPRKIILILSDGNPDSATSTVQSIKHGTKLGFEFYGLGIQHDAIRQYLPDSSVVINDLNELAPSMFSLLQRSLVGA